MCNVLKKHELVAFPHSYKPKRLVELESNLGSVETKTTLLTTKLQQLECYTSF